MKAQSRKSDIKVLFLDVDGVLHTRYCFDGKLRADQIQNLTQIVSATDCKIVLSSTWILRQKWKDDLFDALRAKGGLATFVGDTPLIGDGLARALEIESSLRDVADAFNVVAVAASASGVPSSRS